LNKANVSSNAQNLIAGLYFKQVYYCKQGVDDGDVHIEGAETADNSRGVVVKSFPDGLRKIAFVLLALLTLFPFVDTAVALAAGIIFSLVISNPFSTHTGKLSKLFLQVSVVGLGFGIGISQVIQEGMHSLLYTVIGITLTMIAGILLGRLFKVNTTTSTLISFGTAICGGSAIAAMAPVLKAKNEEIAVSLATVFTLNSVALLLFPEIGHLLHMSQKSFGLWSALAIHDTSSVVGAAASYGSEALAVGTTVKLTRALWITPVVLGFAYFKKSGQKATFPFFILGFVVAAIIRSLFPDFHVVWDGIAFGAKRLLVLTLFLIGAGLTKEVLKKVGFTSMMQGIVLWIIVSISVLLLITGQVIA
jgi:uncharacterized integral membrane protein (TIGR00698 family)